MHRFFFMGFVDGPLPTFSCYKTQKYTFNICIASQSFTGAKQTDAIIYIFWK